MSTTPSQHAFSRQSAFTIVELLIVIVVVAILAIIVVVAYTGVQTQARTAAAKEGLAQAKKKLALYQVTNSTFPTTGNLSLAGITDGDTSYQYTSDGTTYCLTATNSTISYYLNSTTNTTPTSGGCAGHGQGGQSAVTNLAVNPSLETNTTSWSPNWGTSGAGTATRMTDGGQSGSAYHRMTWSTAPTVTWGGITISSIPVTAGQAYSAAVWVRISSPQSIRLSLRPNTYPTDGDITGASVAVSANTWTRLSVSTVTIPAGVVSVSPITNRQGSGSWQPSDVLDDDSFILVQSSSLPNFADGNSPNWIWNGTANNSTSTGPPV